MWPEGSEEVSENDILKKREKMRDKKEPKRPGERERMKDGLMLATLRHPK